MNGYSIRIDVEKRLAEEFAHEIEEAGRIGLISEEDAKSIVERLRKKASNIVVKLFEPKRVEAKLSGDLVNLRHVRCSKCGKVYELDRLDKEKRKRLKCANCNGLLVPTPLWCISGRTQALGIKRITTSEGIKIALSIEEYSLGRGHKDIPERITIEDKSRPLANLKFVYNKSLVKDVSYFHRRANFDYLLTPMPSESITKPITITVFAYNEDSCTEVKTTTGEFKGLSKIMFCNYLEVLQVTVGYRAGHPRTSRAQRVFVINMDKDRMGRAVYRLPARRITTRGLIIRVDTQILQDSVKKHGLNINLWTALHTISHAFLVSLPRITGLEGSDFGEAISTKNGEVAVFDNSMWGLGGVEGVVRVSDMYNFDKFVDRQSLVLDPNYEWSVRESYKCQLACLKACRACLYTDSCFMLNYKLDRKVLMSLGW